MLFLLLAIAGAPTFAQDVAPIVYTQCAPCHHPGQPTPFSLLNYEDVKRHGHQIAAVTASRYMPPWLPEPGFGSFADEHRLTDQQIRTISEWVRAGMSEGDKTTEPASPDYPSGWQLGTPDLVMEAPRPFVAPATGPDVFWNFVFHPDLTAPRYVSAIEIRPGASKGIHHANILLDRVGSLRRFEASPGAGFEGMDVAVSRSAFDPDSHFLFWKPGSIPQREPKGFSWRLDPGNLLVLNTHIQTTGKPEHVQPEIGIYFTDKPPTHFPLLIELENDNALNIPAGDHNFEVSDDLKLPVDVDVLAIYPHAHYLGKLLEAYATLPDGTCRWLIRIPHWNLAWQAVYRYEAPVPLPAGSVISMRFHYDNPTSKRVLAGNNATDEMGHLWLQILPRGTGDHRREIQEAVVQHRLAKNPGDATAHLNLAAILLARLDGQAAATQALDALRLEPRRPEAHDLLGMSLSQTGRLQDAIVQFRQAVALDPTDVNARYNLARSLARTGNYAEAARQFATVAQAYPKIASVQRQYQELLQKAKQN